MILCGNRAHGMPPTIYHESKEDIKACCAGGDVFAYDALGQPFSEVPEGSNGVLGRRGEAWRSRVEAAWRQHVVEHDFFDGDLEVARAEKIKFYRRRWIRRRDINLRSLW